MHLFTAASLKNRALIALVTIVAAVFGVLSMGSLKQEIMPSVQFPTIAVLTTYPGASPDVVNNDVSEPIETAMRGVADLETTTATSSTGSSMVLAEFTYGVDITATEQRVERALSRISDRLPDAADSQVVSGSIDDFPVVQIAVTPPEGTDAEETADLIERISLPELSDLAGVREAQLTGARGDRITITPDTSALEENGLSAQSITDTLQQSGVLVAAGTVQDEDRTLSVQVGSELQSADDIAGLPVTRSAQDLAALQQQQTEGQLPGEQPGVDPGQDPGAQVPGAETPAAEPPAVNIGDVAEVSLEPNPQESISRVNGEPAITIAITKMSAANTVEVSHAVLDAMPGIESALGGAQLDVVFDQAPYIEQSIETLSTEGLLGLVFAVIVILVFLMSMRATLVTAISIPTSLLITIIGLNFADYTLNLLTLGALTISIGRVVDDSIVVIENIKRHLTEESDRGPTIIRAVREVAGAITASTVATIAVFLPMAFVDGMVGELFRPFSFTAALALGASLFVSLTIVPVLAYWFLRPASYARRPKWLQRRDVPVEAMVAAERDPDHETPLQRAYKPIIDWTLKRPAATLIIAALVFGGTVSLAFTPLLKTNYLGDDEQNSVGLTQTLEPGTTLEAQLAQAEKVEGALEGIDAVDTVQVTIGDNGGMGAIFGSGGDGTVTYSITTDPDAQQTEVQDQIRTAVDGLDDAGDFSIGASDGGVTASSAIEVNVTAPDQETLAAASDAVVEELQGREGLVQVESDLASSRPYLRVQVDRAAAADAGLTEAALANLVAQRMQPTEVGQVTMEANTIGVYLADGVAPDDVAGVRALEVPTAEGNERLSDLASVDLADGPVTVRTEDTVRMVTVSALPEGDNLTAAGNEVSAALEAVELPDGASASVGGVMSQQAEAFEQLGIALLAAILIVYVVMVATFKSLLQPILLLISVPFAATGTILLLIATGIPLGVASLIGVLMLIGIVVTNAIVLVDLVNQFRSRGESLRRAVEHGSLLRLRPIIMTALATILALTPMGLGITGKGGFISQPLAVVVIGGLLSSTVLTLVVLPTLYYVVERSRERRAERRRWARSPEGPGPEGPGPDGAGPDRSGPGGAGHRAADDSIAGSHQATHAAAPEAAERSDEAERTPRRGRRGAVLPAASAAPALAAGAVPAAGEAGEASGEHAGRWSRLASRFSRGSGAAGEHGTPAPSRDAAAHAAAQAEEEYRAFLAATQAAAAREQEEAEEVGEAEEAGTAEADSEAAEAEVAEADALAGSAGSEGSVAEEPAGAESDVAAAELHIAADADESERVPEPEAAAEADTASEPVPEPVPDADRFETERIEDAELVDPEPVAAAEATDDAEVVEDAESIEDAEGIEDAEVVEDAEDLEDAEIVEDAKDLEDAEIADDAEGIDDVDVVDPDIVESGIVVSEEVSLGDAESSSDGAGTDDSASDAETDDFDAFRPSPATGEIGWDQLMAEAYLDTQVHRPHTVNELDTVVARQQAETTAASDPEEASEPEEASDPEADTEPAPESDGGSVDETAPQAEPEPEQEPEPASVPEDRRPVEAEPNAAAEAPATTEIAESEPAAPEPEEPIQEPEPTQEPEPEPVAEHESAAEHEPAAEPEPLAEHEPAAEPEPSAEASDATEEELAPLTLPGPPIITGGSRADSEAGPGADVSAGPSQGPEIAGPDTAANFLQDLFASEDDEDEDEEGAVDDADEDHEGESDR